MKLPDAARSAIDQIVDRTVVTGQLRVCKERLEEFAPTDPAAVAEARGLLCSILGVGRVTTESVLAELADVSAFVLRKGWCPKVPVGTDL